MLEASKPPWCMVHFAPMRLGIWPRRRAPGVVAQLGRRGGHQDVGLFQVARGCDAAMLLGDFGEDVGQVFGGRGGAALHCRALRGPSGQALGIRPTALNMPWRLLHQSAIMSMPIRADQRARPHIVHES